MNHGHSALQNQNPSVDPTDWSSICDELQTQLPAELVEISGNRLRIEAAIAKLDIGDVLRHLCVHVLTPDHKREIVRFELDTEPSGAVASTLAAIISKARDKKTSAEDTVGLIRECLEESGPYSFKKLAPKKNPLIQPTMERDIPDFDKFARDPRSIDTLFSVEQTVNGQVVRAVASLYPERKYTLVEAFTDPKNGDLPSPVTRLKVRCPEKFWDIPRTSEEIIAELHTSTWSALESILKEGVARGSQAISRPDVDGRLFFGQINPSTCDSIYPLPSGARVLIEEGDKVVCVRVESSADTEATSFFWRITADGGLLLPDDTRLITARSAAESLAASDPQRRRAAIQTLDRLEHGAPNRLPIEARLRAPFDTFPLDHIAGYDVASQLETLSRSLVSVVKPTSELLVLDLLDGFHSIKFTFRDPGYNRRNPQDPDVMFLAFRPDGALKVTVVSPLRNHLETLVPSSYFERHEPLEETVARLASLFDQQTPAAFNSLRGEIERLSGFSDDELPSSSILRPVLTRYPSVHRSAINRSLDTAAEMALVYEADVPTSISEVQICFDDATCCEMIVSNSFAQPPVRLHLQVSEFGVHAIDLYSTANKAQARYPFLLRTPLTLPEGREILTSLFRLLHAQPDDAPRKPQDEAPPITSTSLFKYLQECERRFSVT